VRCSELGKEVVTFAEVDDVQSSKENRVEGVVQGGYGGCRGSGMVCRFVG
jgi:hypothetical protein